MSTVDVQWLTRESYGIIALRGQHDEMNDTWFLHTPVSNRAKKLCHSLVGSQAPATSQIDKDGRFCQLAPKPIWEVRNSIYLQ